MTRPRMLLGGAALVLFLAICSAIQSCRNAAEPVPVVITRPPPPDPPQVTQAAAVTPSRPTSADAAAAPAADPAGSKSSTDAAAKTTPETATIMVHVVGAVKKPGVYHLPPKARLLDAVHAAGGAKAGADLEAVNLADFVKDAEQIRVPALSERRLPRGAAAVTPGSPHSRVVVPSRPVRSTGHYPLTSSSPIAGAPQSSAARGAGAKKMTGVVEINSAGAEELTTLPGVGPKTAAAILAYRQEHGPFQRVEDLLEIRGIGEKKLAKMREWVSVK